MAGLNFGVDSGLWTLMAQNGDEPQKVGELAEKLGIDHVLLSMCHRSSPVAYLASLINTLQGRLMRHLGAMGYLIEIGADEYSLTNYTRAMSIPVIGNGYLAM
jgi:hypothetical protein